MRELLRVPVRILAFLRKEVVEVLRQPQMLFTLVIGPFLLLSLVGIGYRNEPRLFRTLIVTPDDPALVEQVRSYSELLQPQLVVQDILHDEAEARRRLRQGEADLVVVTPVNAEETIRNNAQAEFRLYHNEIDPTQAGYVAFVGQFYADFVNRRVLRNLAEQGQQEAANAQADIGEARAAATAMREGLERRDVTTARDRQQALAERVSALEVALGLGAGVAGRLAQTAGGQPGEADVLALLQKVRRDTNALSSLSSNCAECEREAERAREVETDLARLDDLLTQYRSLDPTVLVSPFRAVTEGIAVVQPRATDYFTPAVLTLLLQHLSVTFAALSVVRERRLGAIELFRVSPLSAAEALLGKYLSYLVFGGVLAALLGLLVVYVLRVPMLGDWGNYALIVAAVLFTSLGFGFVISLLAQTETQAVQAAMLLLLASVFFGGLFLNLNLLWAPIRFISWLLPATYGTELLQSLMLRGLPPRPLLFVGLASLGLLLFVISWSRMKRLMARR